MLCLRVSSSWNYKLLTIILGTFYFDSDQIRVTFPCLFFPALWSLCSPLLQMFIKYLTDCELEHHPTVVQNTNACLLLHSGCTVPSYTPPFNTSTLLELIRPLIITVLHANSCFCKAICAFLIML